MRMTDIRPLPVIDYSLSVRRIAIMRALYLGDLLLAVPAFRALRARYPNTEMTLIGLPWAKSFAQRFSQYLDRFIAFPGYPGIAEEAHDPERTARFLAAQRTYHYDLVIQMHGSGEASNPFALALGGRGAVGYYRSTPPAGLTACAPYPSGEPEIMRNLGLARLAGCRWLDTVLEFPVLAADREEASALLRGVSDDALLVGIHPGAKACARRWMPERFAEVADTLIERYGARVVLVGSASDSGYACAVRAAMRHAPLDLTGKTSLGGLAAIFERMRLFIGNDSGPSHLAEAVGTPSVTVFGPGDPRCWAPLDQRSHRVVREPVECNPCAYADCPIDHRCLRRITPAHVLAHAHELLAKGVRACGA